MMGGILDVCIFVFDCFCVHVFISVFVYLQHKAPYNEVGGAEGYGA